VLAIAEATGKDTALAETLPVAIELAHARGDERAAAAHTQRLAALERADAP
jgi:hypothetical protein